MENEFQYLWSSLEREVPDFPIDSFQYEKREYSTAINFRSVTRTWTVSLCVCRVESGLCLSSYLCMYLCWLVTWKFNNIEVDLSILIGRLIIPTTNQSGARPPEFHKLRIQTAESANVSLLCKVNPCVIFSRGRSRTELVDERSMFALAFVIF